MPFRHVSRTVVVTIATVTTIATAVTASPPPPHHHHTNHCRPRRRRRFDGTNGCEGYDRYPAWCPKFGPGTDAIRHCCVCGGGQKVRYRFAVGDVVDIWGSPLESPRYDMIH